MNMNLYFFFSFSSPPSSGGWRLPVEAIIINVRFKWISTDHRMQITYLSESVSHKLQSHKKSKNWCEGRSKSFAHVELVSSVGQCITAACQAFLFFPLFVCTAEPVQCLVFSHLKYHTFNTGVYVTDVSFGLILFFISTYFLGCVILTYCHACHISSFQASYLWF